MSLDTVDFSKRPDKPPVCIECGSDARLATGAEAYPPHETFLHDQPMWVCDCGAYCRCQGGTIKPVGKPALAETRASQTRALLAQQAAFDALRASGASWSNATRRSRKAWLTVLKVGWGRRGCHPRSLTKPQAEALIERMAQVAQHAGEEDSAP